MKLSRFCGYKTLISLSTIWVTILFILSFYVNYNKQKRTESKKNFFTHPPPLKRVFGKNYRPTTRVEPDFQKPLVYMVSMITPKEFTPKKFLNESSTSKHPLIFLYTQGIERRNRVVSENFKMNVTSCMIGKKEYPIFFRSTGVYSCSVTHNIKKNTRITLAISSDIYEKKPQAPLEKATKKILKKKRIKDGRYLIPSIVKWDEQIDDPPKKSEGKYEICAMTQERLFPELIDPWISYHRRLGIDKFYIYDNGCKDNLRRRFKNREDIEILTWLWEKSQLQAQNHFLVHARTRCHWVILFDVDEYIALRNSGSWEESRVQEVGKLKSYLRFAKANGLSQIIMRPLDMGSSGIIKQSRNPPPESFIHMLHTEHQNSTKTIAYSMHSAPDSHVHTITKLKGYKFLTTRLALVKYSKLPSIGIVHYKMRSWEEYYKKAKGPRGSIFINTWNTTKWTIDKIHGHFLKVQPHLRFIKFRSMWREALKLGIPDQVILPRDEQEYDIFIKNNTLNDISGILNASSVD